ncbi:MAG TPA: hypothetical protein VF503_21650 [Sphingobium sp.]|uniref:hypothetical protein n=1 Tax=Sphingobium sp. TaxID=1912891 RepID=UPI002ED37748
MSIFDGILGNLEGVAEKLGIPTDQLQSLAASAQEKLANGGDLSSLLATAQEHGISMDKIQELMGHASVGDLMGKAQEALGGQEGGDSLLGGLADKAKGFFSKE